jgi:hypothetical protein
LWELPGILAADAARPQHLAMRVRQDDPHVGAEAIGIDHDSVTLENSARCVAP